MLLWTSSSPVLFVNPPLSLSKWSPARAVACVSWNTNIVIRKVTFPSTVNFVSKYHNKKGSVQIWNALSMQNIQLHSYTQTHIHPPSHRESLLLRNHTKIFLSICLFIYLSVCLSGLLYSYICLYLYSYPSLEKWLTNSVFCTEVLTNVWSFLSSNLLMDFLRLSARIFLSTVINPGT
jgi:hypothetical protein